MTTARILQGDARACLADLPDRSVHCAVTSPPYWGLRDYGVPGQIGQETRPDCVGWATGAPCGECYVCHLIAVFRQVRRVLRDDGTLWCNLGDSYAGSWGNYGARGGQQRSRIAERWHRPGYEDPRTDYDGLPPTAKVAGLKPKDLVGIPWRVAFALQADGWWLRRDIVWSKANPMPESVTDRPSSAHEYLFLLAKSQRYFYDQEAVKQPSGGWHNGIFTDARKLSIRPDTGTAPRTETPSANLRSVWHFGTQPYTGAHFATFPEELPRRCIRAGTSEHGVCPNCGAPWTRVIERDGTPHDGATSSAYPTGTTANRLALLRQAARERGEEYTNTTITTGWQPTCACAAGDPTPATVLDPFLGSGTTLAVAAQLGRHGIGVELKPAYIALARDRITAHSPLLTEIIS